MKSLSYLFMLIALTSCAINNTLDTYCVQKENGISMETKSGSGRPPQLDSLLALSMAQLNHNIILFNSLYKLDGIYHLGLTLEDAEELGIPAELYMDFKSNLNE